MDYIPILFIAVILFFVLIDMHLDNAVKLGIRAATWIIVIAILLVFYFLLRSHGML